MPHLVETTLDKKLCEKFPKLKTWKRYFAVNLVNFRHLFIGK